MKKLSNYLAFTAILLCLGFMSAYGQNDSKYKVVINHEEQYSIWPLDKITPIGWKETETQGVQSKCQAYIKEVWTDMRPLSIQKMNLPGNSKYMVVINHEEQYSVWPIKLDLPENWKALKIKGTLAKCTRYIKNVWTDMRPLSVRKKTD